VTIVIPCHSIIFLLFLEKEKKKKEKHKIEKVLVKNRKTLHKRLELLQLKDFRVGQCKEPCIRVNTRELNRELCTELSILYTKAT